MKKLFNIHPKHTCRLKHMLVPSKVLFITLLILPISWLNLSAPITRYHPCNHSFLTFHELSDLETKPLLPVSSMDWLILLTHSPIVFHSPFLFRALLSPVYQVSLLLLLSILVHHYRICMLIAKCFWPSCYVECYQTWFSPSIHRLVMVVLTIFFYCRLPLSTRGYLDQPAW